MSIGMRGILLTVLIVFAFGAARAAEGPTKDEAVAMVKKAAAAIKSEGTEKAYAEISDTKGPFIDRDLYVVVYGMDGVVLAHGGDKKLVGVNRLHGKDVDGKEFVKERVELAKTEPSFWQNYKYLNPVTKKIEPKQMYCERLNDTVVCGGIYQS
jgi:signal transduction histidine kinase